MKKKYFILILFTVYCLCRPSSSILGKIASQFSPGLFTKAAYAASPHLELDPSTGAISTSGTDIEVNIDTDGEAVKSAKAVINYPTDMLEVSSVTAGTFFDDVSHNIYNDEGEVVINANLSIDSMLDSKTGTGTLATITFTAKVSSGTAVVTFDCSSDVSTDSNINDPSDPPLDIITCSANIDGNYSWGASAVSPSPGTTTTTTGGGTTTTTGGGTTTTTGGGAAAGGTTYPDTGVSAPTIALLIGGLLLLLAPIFI
jgi:hypothetical protein